MYNYRTSNGDDFDDSCLLALRIQQAIQVEQSNQAMVEVVGRRMKAAAVVVRKIVDKDDEPDVDEPDVNEPDIDVVVVVVVDLQI